MRSDGRAARVPGEAARAGASTGGRARAPRPPRSKSPGSDRTVEEYLAGVPAPERGALQALRSTIRSAAPEASEKIQYKMPTYEHQGLLVGFAAFRGHLGFYVMSPAVVAKFAAELKRFDVGKGCIRFRADRPLPTGLVTKIVRARLEENGARSG
jgi:uncharacterized protein YdhG (YjbR/CyaY superfamily)